MLNKFICEGLLPSHYNLSKLYNTYCLFIVLFFILCACTTSVEEESDMALAPTAPPAFNPNSYDAFSYSMAGNAEVPTGNTEPPMGNTEPPMGNTEPPMGNTEPPMGNTEPPMGNTEPPMGNTEPPMGNMEMTTCTPGESLGICEVCDANGMPTMSVSDVNCPIPDCTQSSYELVEEDGNRICYQNSFMLPDTGNCEAIGMCKDLESLQCETSSVEEVARLTDTCQQLEGCSDQDPPMLIDSENGLECNTWGSCQAGQCNVPIECSQFEDYNQGENLFCQYRDDNGQKWCEFYVDGVNADMNDDDGRITCNDFCQQMGQGASCLRGWNNRNGRSCQKDDDIGCDANYQSQICRCLVP